MDRPLIAILRGGFTGESVISHQSAARMMQAVDRERFDPAFVTVSREGWSAFDPEENPIPFDRASFTLHRNGRDERIAAALIAIHGPPGEDGRIQGYLELLGVPCQTGDVLNMALTFSKYATVSLLRQMAFNVAPSVMLPARGAMNEAEILDVTGLPCFVKPDQSGSSLGMSKVKAKEELGPALDKAFAEGGAVMVEGAVTGRELTCGVLRMAGRTQALPVCEVRTTREFFDYQAKYHDSGTQELIPAPIPDEVTRLVQHRSEMIFTALNCRGMARVDHIWTGSDLITIEVNTTPGFSGASIYPKMLEVSGIGVPAAVNGLIEEMLQRSR